jgi:hypothetical protein
MLAELLGVCVFFSSAIFMDSSKEFQEFDVSWRKVSWINDSCGVSFGVSCGVVQVLRKGSCTINSLRGSWSILV